MKEHWRADGGELVNDGKGDYATTEKDFGNFELLVDYKTVAGADSGIYLRGCPQVQIWDINQPSRAENPDRNPNKGSGGLFNNTPRTLGRDPVPAENARTKDEHPAVGGIRQIADDLGHGLVVGGFVLARIRQIVGHGKETLRWVVERRRKHLANRHRRRRLVQSEA